jgi:hypothetical protein
VSFTVTPSEAPICLSTLDDGTRLGSWEGLIGFGDTCIVGCVKRARLWLIAEKYSERALNYLECDSSGDSREERVHLRRRKELEWEQSEPNPVCVFPQRGTQGGMRRIRTGTNTVRPRTSIVGTQQAP